MCCSPELPPSALSTPTQAGVLAGTRRTGCGTPTRASCIPARDTRAGRVLPNPPLSQWPPASSSRGTTSSPAAVAVCDLHPTQRCLPTLEPVAPAPPPRRRHRRHKHGKSRIDHCQHHTRMHNSKEKAIRSDVPGPPLTVSGVPRRQSPPQAWACQQSSPPASAEMKHKHNSALCRKVPIPLRLLCQNLRFGHESKIKSHGQCPDFVVSSLTQGPPPQHTPPSAHIRKTWPGTANAVTPQLAHSLNHDDPLTRRRRKSAGRSC